MNVYRDLGRSTFGVCPANCELTSGRTARRSTCLSDLAGGCPRPPTRDYRPGVSGRPSSGRTKTQQPEQCVGLITDLLLFTVTLSSDNLIEELQKAGAWTPNGSCRKVPT